MRYIDADKLQKDGWKLRREKQGLLTSTYETMELDCVPTADVRENVRGEWIKIHWKAFRCSECKGISEYYTDFCPNCGAQMRGESK